MHKEISLAIKLRTPCPLNNLSANTRELHNFFASILILQNSNNSSSCRHLSLRALREKGLEIILFQTKLIIIAYFYS